MLYAAVRKAIRQTLEKDRIKVAIYTHISHLYETGASLYFSIIANRDPKSPLGQWNEMKDVVGRTIVDHGGVISHHHGIGLDHKAFLNASECEMKALRKIKTVLDPEGIMNPEKLF